MSVLVLEFSMMNEEFLVSVIHQIGLIMSLVVVVRDVTKVGGRMHPSCLLHQPDHHASRTPHDSNESATARHHSPSG
jgi:hypothetical protein